MTFVLYLLKWLKYDSPHTLRMDVAAHFASYKSEENNCITTPNFPRCFKISWLWFLIASILIKIFTFLEASTYFRWALYMYTNQYQEDLIGMDWHWFNISHFRSISQFLLASSIDLGIPWGKIGQDLCLGMHNNRIPLTDVSLSLLYAVWLIVHNR